MGQLSTPKAAKVYTTVYEQLYGVDYRRDITSVDKYHSPEMVNMISDFGGNPIKRNGYRRASSVAYTSIISTDIGVFGVSLSPADGSLSINKLNIDGYPEHTNLDVEWSDSVAGNFGRINCVFNWQNKLFILCKNGVVKFDTKERKSSVSGIGTGMMSIGAVGGSAPVNEDVVPVVTIGLKPNGTGGTSYYDPNVMSIYRAVQFGGDGVSKEYVIPAYKYIGNWVKVEILSETTGEWEVTTAYTLEASETKTGRTLDGTGSFDSIVHGTKITFNTAPYSVGQGDDYHDNVRITFAPFDSTVYQGTVCNGFYSEKMIQLLDSGIATYHDNRLFIADGSKTYYSDVNEPFSISDLHWFEVDNEIMCYTRASSYLAIITKDDGKNTVFLASQTTVTTASDENSNSVDDYAYAVKPSNAGVGAISRKCLGVFNDEPVFLSSTGLYAILTNYQSEKYAVNRSGKINRQLCDEPNLENAVGIAWNGYYYIAINSKMYVLDSRNRENNSRGDKSYECYYFDSMPAIKDMFVADNKMFFTDGEVTYRWNEDLPEVAKFYDLAHQENGKWTGEPVKAKWTSAFDDDKHPEKLKNLYKKGTLITLMPHYKSGCSITLIKNGNEFEPIGRFNTDMFTFENLSFGRPDVEIEDKTIRDFTFKSNEAASDVFTKKKIKKYKRLQIVVENNEAEPFGIICIVKSYTYGNYAKR